MKHSGITAIVLALATIAILSVQTFFSASQSFSPVFGLALFGITCISLSFLKPNQAKTNASKLSSPISHR
jgi:hypothetical protein